MLRPLKLQAVYVSRGIEGFRGQIYRSISILISIYI